MVVEKWIKVEGFANYMVSNLGRVKSLSKIKTIGNRSFVTKEKILKQILHSNGYLSVTLCENKKTKQINVHRLVAKAFIENKYNKPNINHIDAIKTNNYFKNLEWVTQKENSEHAVKNNLYKNNINEKNGMFGKFGELNINSKKIVQMDKNELVINDYPCIAEASRANKISAGNISAVCNGKRKTCGGFIWKFINN